MGQPSPRGHYIGQAWLVILLALLYGGGLAGVQTTLSGKIAENKRNETYDQIPSLVSGADGTKTVELIVEGKDGKDARVYQARDASGVLCGWVVPASGQGFADRIDLLIGLDVDLATITGMYVLDQKETPGLGDYITGESFRERFRGKPAGAELVAVKADPQAENEVRALTGATISSQSVCDIVNAALTNLREPIREQAGSGGSGDPEQPAS
jgi:electron transport complex protein RnfG